MPSYRYKCKSCSKEIKSSQDRNIRFIECECGQQMKRQVPNLSGSPKVTETIDTYTNTKHVQDQKEIIMSRRDEHYWKVEVPRLVQEHDTKTCLEMGWIVLDEKGRPVIQTTPPSRR